MDPSRPLKIPSINPFIKAPEPLRDKPTQEKKLRKPPSFAADYASTTSTSNNVVASNQHQQDVADSPVESQKPGDFGPAELRPRDSRYVDNQQTNHCNSAADWNPCGTCGHTSEIPGIDWIFCDGCSIWFHGSCAGLSNENISNLAAPSIRWNCLSCINKANASQSQSNTTLVICSRCADMGIMKKCKGLRGLKQHYGHAHKEFQAELSPTPHVTTAEESPKTETSAKEFQLLIAKCKAKLKVIKRIPRGARIAVAINLTSLINKCVTINSVAVWQEFFLFAYHVLHVTSKLIDKRSVTSKIKNNVKSSEIKIDLNNQNPKTVSPSLPRLVESKVYDGNIRGAIRILSSDDTMAPNDPFTFQQLQQKHPNPAQNFVAPEPLNDMDQNQSLKVTTEDIYKAIYSFPNGSAGGIDGLCPQHLKDLIATTTGVAGQKLLAALTELSNMMLEGKVNTDFLPFIYGASLIALKKKDGGIRPIAVGCTIRRLVSKLCCKVMGENLVIN